MRHNTYIYAIKFNESHLKYQQISIALFNIIIASTQSAILFPFLRSV